MKKFKQNYQIQIQIRLVRNYGIQIHQKNANPQDLFPNPNPRSFLYTSTTMLLKWNYFLLTQFKSSPDSKYMKHFAVRAQSKINKVRHSPDPV